MKIRSTHYGAVVSALALAVAAMPAATDAQDSAAPPKAVAVGQPAARTLVDDAVKIAAERKQTVLVLFHASWCGWCKRLDAALTSPELAPIIGAHFVTIHLDVLEQGENKKLENPGGADYLAKWGGTRSGLPFYVFLDGTGKKVADSNAMPRGQNIGYPATPEEIDAFLGLLTKTAPRLTEGEKNRIAGFLKKNAPAPPAPAPVARP